MIKNKPANQALKLCAVAIALCTALSPFASDASAAENASLSLATEPVSVPVDDLLSATDARLYERIFDIQEDGEWREADRLIAQLGDRLLLGHVLAQRYLHPTKYRTSYRELSDWLKKYGDHPDAHRLYEIALKRKPKRAAYPERPEGAAYGSFDPYAIIEHSGYRPSDSEARQIISRIHRMTRLRQLSGAEDYLAGRAVQQQLGVRGIDLARTIVASGWFFQGDGERAFSLADRAAARSGSRLPYAHWIAGLSAYRLARYVEAAKHFEAVALSEDVRGWDHAGAAFWAARANMMGKRPERVHRWLAAAAEQPRTFYGILARRWLGDASPFDWTTPSLTRERLEMVTTNPAGRRALALLQVGMDDRAGRELRLISKPEDREMTAALMAIAERKSLPTVSLRAGMGMSATEQLKNAASLYPVPAWEPKEGFRVDRALIFAFMRQESAFNIRARSSAGARGLMQLMPATAGFIAQQRFSGKRRNQLYDPELNLSLGQQYILHLLENQVVDGDLLLLAAAYNGGPGNLKKWQRRAERNDYTDALMFIESIPARETRIFIERVLSNLWMYRERLGEPSPSLDALAAGERPLYIAVEGTNRSVAEDVRD
jgi:soluble lytic murein transglycosylase